MKRFILLLFLYSCFVTTSAFADDEVQGNIHQWRSYTAFTGIDEVVVLGDYVYALSSNALFSVNKKTDEIEYYTRLTGLSSVRIDRIAYNPVLNKMLITYQDGQLDIMDQKRNIYNISDLFVKQMNVSKQVNDICILQDMAYLAMSFGILAVDMRKMEIRDTYYIGTNSSEVNVKAITIKDNKLYAITTDKLYSADLSNNLSDYNYWHIQALPATGEIQGMRAHNGKLYLVQNKQLSVLIDQNWKLLELKDNTISKNPIALRGICTTENHIYVLPEEAHGVLEVHDDFHTERTLLYGFVNGYENQAKRIKPFHIKDQPPCYQLTVFLVFILTFGMLKVNNNVKIAANRASQLFSQTDSRITYIVLKNYFCSVLLVSVTIHKPRIY